MRNLVRVGWLAASADPNVASIRYRCFHPARALSDLGVENYVYKNASTLTEDLPNLDAVVVVKQLRVDVVNVAVVARDLRVPVFLDLCDDLLSPEYRRNRLELNRAVFRAVAPLLDAVIVTGDAMADRVRGYGSLNAPVIKIVDVAEDRATLRAVLDYAPSTVARASARQSDQTSLAQFKPAASLAFPPRPERRRASKRAAGRIVWFGNHGGPHSNFGMLSLLNVAPALRALYAETPFELVVVSNHERKFETFLTRLGVPTRYQAWTMETVYDQIERADVALLTGGDDKFSTVKSANRALQALAAGTPVVATPTPALCELRDAVWTQDMKMGLQTYLTDPEAAELAVSKGRAIIKANFSPQAVGEAWRAVLDRFSHAGRARDVAAGRAEDGPPRLLFMIDGAADLSALRPLIDEAIQLGVTAMVLVGEGVMANAAEMVDYLAIQSIVPTMASVPQLEEMDARWLRAADAVVVSGTHAMAGALIRLAQTYGVRSARISDEPLEPAAPDQTDETFPLSASAMLVVQNLTGAAASRWPALARAC